jgi:hypothetical protein
VLSLQGTTYVYGTFFKPYISQHENEIDRNLLELRARATDTVVLYFQKAASAGQSTFFDVLKYVAAKSPSQKSRQRLHQVWIECTITIFFAKKSIESFVVQCSSCLLRCSNFFLLFFSNAILVMMP